MQTFLPVRTLLDHASVILSTGSEGTLLPLVPQVVTVHDITPLVLPTLHPHKSELFFFRYLLPRVLRHSAAVITVSESTKEDLIKVYHLPSEKIHVIYNGYDTMLFYPREDARDVIRSYGFKDYIYYAGNILPHKNVARLIRAFKLIAPKIPHQLVLQGWFNSTYMSELETLVRDLNIEDRVVFLGYVPLDHLPYLYSGATVFVTVSLYEGFGLPPLEAMACGTPVVASNSSSLPEVVGNAGILVDPNDTKQISEGLLRVIEHPELRAELSRKAVRRAASFSWVATARQALEVLKGVTSAQNDKRHIQAILG